MATEEQTRKVKQKIMEYLRKQGFDVTPMNGSDISCILMTDIKAEGFK